MANVLFSEGSSPVWFECQSGDKWSLDPNPREYYACSILDYSFSLLENIDGIALYPHPDGTTRYVVTTWWYHQVVTTFEVRVLESDGEKWSPIKIVVTTFWVSKALSTCGEMITSSSSAILVTFEVRLLDGGKWSLTQSGPLQNPPLPNSQWPPIKGWKVKGNSPPNSKRLRKGAGAHLLEEYIVSGWKC